MINYTNQTVIDGGATESATKTWRPMRELVPVDTTVDTITNLQKKMQSVTVAVDTTAAATDTTTIPTTVLQMSGVSATESPFKTTSGQMVSIVAVSFTANPADPQFAGVQIWFTGYNGSSTPQLMAEGRTSPVQFLCDTTHETVTVTVIAFHADGTTSATFTAPTTTVLLDGVTSAPPSPSISQTLFAVPLGYQFAFTQLTALGADLIDSYRVYRATSNSFGAASLIRTIKHDPTSSGNIVVQDMVDGGVIYYYWVTAVNTTGLESLPTSAQSVATSSFPGSLAAAYSSYTFTSPSVISQSGTSTTINLSGSTAQFPSGTVSYNSGSVNPGLYGTFYIYGDDPTYAGGAVTYVATTSNPTVTANPGRIYYGKITTVAGGGGTGGGGGNGPCFSLNTLLMSKSIGEIAVGDEVVVELDNGEYVMRRVSAVFDHFYEGVMYDMGDGELVTPRHQFRDSGTWKRAEEIFTETVHYSGWVRNLHICTDKEEERNYVLANGRSAHNLNKL